MSLHDRCLSAQTVAPATAGDAFVVFFYGGWKRTINRTIGATFLVPGEPFLCLRLGRKAGAVIPGGGSFGVETSCADVEAAFVVNGALSRPAAQVIHQGLRHNFIEMAGGLGGGG